MATEQKNLAQQMRERINKRAGKKVTMETVKIEDLIQVESWIGMPPHFRRAVGARGVPNGHIIQYVGKSDTGKTTEIMIIMIGIQRAGGVVYLIDSEHKFSFERFRLMGGVPEDIVLMPADSLEECWEHWKVITDEVGEFRKKDRVTPMGVFWDSVAASVPDAVMAKEAGESTVAVEAKINNAEIRKIKKMVKKNLMTAVFINHSYWTMPKVGAPEEVLKGGSEMFFMSTLILKTKRIGWLDRTINKVDERFGAHCVLMVMKGHLGGSRANTEFYIVGQGVLETKEELEDYKDLITGIEGPDINLLTMDQLREIRMNRHLKKLETEEIPVPVGLDWKSVKAIYDENFAKRDAEAAAAAAEEGRPKKGLGSKKKKKGKKDGDSKAS